MDSPSTNDWLVVTGCHFWHFPINIGLLSSSQLTNSYFSIWLGNVKSSQLTNSIIFQRGGKKPPTRWGLNEWCVPGTSMEWTPPFGRGQQMLRSLKNGLEKNGTFCGEHDDLWIIEGLFVLLFSDKPVLFGRSFGPKLDWCCWIVLFHGL